MKIALIIERYDPTRGGAERSTVEMAACLAQLGHEITVVAGSVVEATENDDHTLPFRLHDLRISPGRTQHTYAQFQNVLADHLTGQGYDISHSMMPLLDVDIYQPRGGSTLNAMRRHIAAYDCPCVRACKRATAGWNRSRRTRIDAERRLCAAPQGPTVIALSTYVAQQFRDDYDLSDGRLRLVPNGIDVEPYTDRQACLDGHKLRQCYDPNDELALFVFVAQNFRLKGLTQLIRAAQLAKSRRQDQHRHFRIMVFGDEPFGPYYRVTAKLQLTDEILFMGSTTEMPAVLHMADAAVLPTWGDACSRTVLESLSAGRPAITTRFNGAADFLDADKFGLIIDEPDNLSALADGLLALCDRQHCQRLTQAIHDAQLHDRLSMHRHARQLVDVYEEIIRRRS